MGNVVHFGPPNKRSQWLSWLVVVGLIVLAALWQFDFHGLPVIDSNGQNGSSRLIVGRASVIDGDTIEILGTRIRLYGIDAPERDQLCVVEGNEFRCGQRASFALADKISTSTVMCKPKDHDRYGRVVAVCRSGGEDLNEWMVAQGWALAYRRYSRDYIQQEKQAAASKVGMWKGKFVAPWDWRRGVRTVAD